MKKPVFIVGLLFVAIATPAPRAQQERAAFATDAGLTVLTPTRHPPVPHDLSQLWLAPDRGGSATRSAPILPLANAAKLAAGGDFTKTLAIVSQPVVRQGALGEYATYYAAVAQLKLKR
jgi:hypothetical protein